MDEIKESIYSIKKSQITLVNDLQKFVDNTSASLINFESDIKKIQNRCDEIEYVLSDITKDMILSKNKFDKMQYLNDNLKAQLRYPFSGVNFECLKLYIDMNGHKFIYGLTSKILYDSFEEELIVKPNYHIENTWGEHVYINIKIDNVLNSFEVSFLFDSNQLFWCLQFDGLFFHIETNECKSKSYCRHEYIRILFDSNKNIISGVGSGSDFSSIKLVPCNIECNYIRTWVFSSYAIIKIKRKEDVIFNVEINGMVYTS